MVREEWEEEMAKILRKVNKTLPRAFLCEYFYSGIHFNVCLYLTVRYMIFLSPHIHLDFTKPPYTLNPSLELNFTLKSNIFTNILFSFHFQFNLNTTMAAKGKRPMRHLTATDKIEAIQRIHDGESKASVARDIGVPESTLRGWCKNEEKLRYMSRQSTPDNKQSIVKMDDDAAGNLLGGPPEKRQKLDTSLPLNFGIGGGGNGKLKYEDMYKRSSMGGLDLSSRLGDMNGLSDYSQYAKQQDYHVNGKLSMKGYGADLTKPSDPTKSDLSMAAISPLTSLSHLSGMSGLGQNPMALSFNELTSNLNLIAQFSNNANLAGMSGLGGLNTTPQSLRTSRPKPMSSHSPRGESEKAQSLTVKNLSKLQQKQTSPNDFMSGMNLAADKNKKTSTNTNSRDAPVDDALWYWLKSQQTMLGLQNSLYSSMSGTNQQMGLSPQPQHSPQQQMRQHTPIPPTVSSPQITPPSTTPSANSDDTKNSSWFWQWYKTFGNSMIGSTMLADKQNSINNNTINNNSSKSPITSSYENILYSQLTKGNNIDSLNNNNNIEQILTPKPEDLSARHHNVENMPFVPTTPSPTLLIKVEDKTDEKMEEDKSPGKVRAVLDNLLFNNNYNEIKSEFDDSEMSDSVEALEHGEKFLKWLESYSDPSITALQVMRFRYLLNSIKTSADRANNSTLVYGERSKVRRRK